MAGRIRGLSLYIRDQNCARSQSRKTPVAFSSPAHRSSRSRVLVADFLVADELGHHHVVEDRRPRGRPMDSPSLVDECRQILRELVANLVVPDPVGVGRRVVDSEPREE